MSNQHWILGSSGGALPRERKGDCGKHSPCRDARHADPEDLAGQVSAHIDVIGSPMNTHRSQQPAVWPYLTPVFGDECVTIKCSESTNFLKLQCDSLSFEMRVSRRRKLV